MNGLWAGTKWRVCWMLIVHIAVDNCKPFGIAKGDEEYETMVAIRIRQGGGQF